MDNSFIYLFVGLVVSLLVSNKYNIYKANKSQVDALKAKDDAQLGAVKQSVHEALDNAQKTDAERQKEESEL